MRVQVTCVRACMCVVPVVPVLQLVSVIIRDLHVLQLPGGLVIRQVSPLDEVVTVIFLIHTG